MKKITIPQSTYGKTAKYISSSTLRFTVTMDEQTYLTLLRIIEEQKTTRSRCLAGLIKNAAGQLPGMRQFPACIRQQVQREN
tara:strand:+ start:173 stop:418 length:246 start_codon:yes stop_codon:yes gene_type:complete